MSALGAIGSLLGTRTVELTTPLSPQQCADRLRGRVDHGLRPFGSKPVLGFVSDGGIALRKRIGYRNSFQTVLKARLEPDVMGTRLRCRVGMSIFVGVFMVFWLGVVVVSGGGAAVAILSGPTDPVSALALVVPLLMLAFGFGLLLFGRLPARNEGEFLIDFLCRELDARAQAAPLNQEPIVR